MKLPSSYANYAHCMVITNDNKLMTFGGNHEDGKQSYELSKDIWQKQNPLTKPRFMAVAVTMTDGIYCFGGFDNSCTSDFLPNGKSVWQAGPEVPGPGIENGHGVAISPTELLLVGGLQTKDKILKYNIEGKAWTYVGELLQGRWNHRCYFYHGKLIVTGGFNGEYLNSTEIINVSNGTSKRAGNLNVRRVGHGMGIIQRNGKSNLIVFGGYNKDGLYNDSVEEWDDISQIWKETRMKLSESKGYFGYCQIPQSKIQI